MKKIFSGVLSIFVILSMALSLCSCTFDEDEKEKKVDINRSDIPKSSEDIIDYYNNVVIALIKENADKVTCSVAIKQYDNQKTYVNIRDVNAYKITLAEKIDLDKQIAELQKQLDEATKLNDQTKIDELNAKIDELNGAKNQTKNDKMKAAAKGLLNLIVDQRKEREDSLGLPVTGTNIPAPIALNDFVKIKSILGDDNSNPSAVRPSVFYTLNLDLDEYTDPDKNSVLGHLIDLPDFDAYSKELENASDYLKVKGYTITYKESSISIDVDKTNDQLAYITYHINAYVNVEVEGLGKLKDSGINTVEFKVERVLRFKFDWPEEVK